MKIDRSLQNLHPILRPRIVAFLSHPRIDALKYRMFEGYRHPSRQAELLNVGTTKAAPWRSAHQYGLAADCIPQRPRWTWDVDWVEIQEVQEIAHTFELRTPISWDPLHFQAPEWSDVYDRLF